jgi:hypothetical protein
MFDFDHIRPARRCGGTLDENYAETLEESRTFPSGGQVKDQ